MASDVLVVDDEADIRELVAGILTDEGYDVRTANDGESALAAIRARRPALLILDIWMSGGGMDGLELLDLVKGLDTDMPVIMISGHGNIRSEEHTSELQSQSTLVCRLLLEKKNN